MLIKTYLTFEIQVFLAGVMSFLICFFLIPKITLLARDKKLMAFPVKRSSHDNPVPTLGGVGIYLGFIIPLLLFSGINESKILPFLTASCLVIFLVGIKDDIYVISPKTKLGGQIIAAIIMIVFANIRITHFHGIFGIGELPYIASFFISLFIYIAITNSINLLDGIDGLAASIGIVACIGFGVYFVHLEKINSSLGCSSLIGALSAFLIFNYAKGDKKIFMGDTGSLIIGFVLSTFAIFFNEITILSPVEMRVHSAPVVSIAILAIPIFDTIRVFLYRILRGKSPFKPDKTHIHHELLANGYTHHQATTVITAFSIFLILIIYSLQGQMGFYQLLMVLTILVLLFYIVPFTFLYRQLDLKNRMIKYFLRIRLKKQ